MDPMGTNSYYPFFGGRSLSFQKLMRNPLALDSCCGTNKELPFSPNKRTGFLSNSCIDIYIFNKQAIYIYIQYIYIFLPCLAFFVYIISNSFPRPFPKKILQQHTEKPRENPAWPRWNLRQCHKQWPREHNWSHAHGLHSSRCESDKGGWSDLKAGTTSGHVLPSTSTDPPLLIRQKVANMFSCYEGTNSPFGIIQFCVSTLAL